MRYLKIKWPIIYRCDMIIDQSINMKEDDLLKLAEELVPQVSKRVEIYEEQISEPQTSTFSLARLNTSREDVIRFIRSHVRIKRFREIAGELRLANAVSMGKSWEGAFQFLRELDEDQISRVYIFVMFVEKIYRF